MAEEIDYLSYPSVVGSGVKPPSLHHICQKDSPHCKPSKCDICNRGVNLCLHYTEELGLCLYCLRQTNSDSESLIIVDRLLFKQILDIAGEHSDSEIIAVGRDLLKL